MNRNFSKETKIHVLLGAVAVGISLYFLCVSIFGGWADEQNTRCPRDYVLNYMMSKTKEPQERDILYGVKDENGKEVIEPRYAEVGEFNDAGLAIVKVYGNGFEPLSGVIDRSGEYIIQPVYSHIYDHPDGENSYFLVVSYERRLFFDYNGKVIEDMNGR